MKKDIIIGGLASILVLSSGCSVFRGIDRGLMKFADVLARREQQREAMRPENVLRKQGYLLHHGSVVVPPVQNSIVTNIVQHITFSYTAPETIDPLYLTLSREFCDLLGNPYYEERQRIYPAGFSAVESNDASVTYSHTFTSEMLWEKGRYRYTWWHGVPPELHPNFFESMADIFTRNDARLLLEGVYECK